MIGFTEDKKKTAPVQMNVLQVGNGQEPTPKDPFCTKQ